MLKRHFYTIEHPNDIFEQTLLVFEQLEPYIHNTIRTWLFIKDIDDNYRSFSNARNIYFDRIGLKDGPYIASTGIGLPNIHFYPGETIILEALIVPELNKSDLIYMYDLEIMPHTREYGVKFERGVIYKNKYIVSGTASIDKYGNIKHIGNLSKQIHHALENMNNLLLNYGQSIYRAKEITGYVRNADDIIFVKQRCKELIPYIKWNIIEGKVCRPDWLVEFELIIEAENEYSTSM